MGVSEKGDNLLSSEGDEEEFLGPSLFGLLQFDCGLI